MNIPPWIQRMKEGGNVVWCREIYPYICLIDKNDTRSEGMPFGFTVASSTEGNMGSASTFDEAYKRIEDFLARKRLTIPKVPGRIPGMEE